VQSTVDRTAFTLSACTPREESRPNRIRAPGRPQAPQANSPAPAASVLARPRARVCAETARIRLPTHVLRSTSRRRLALPRGPCAHGRGEAYLLTCLQCPAGLIGERVCR
jgi:hypothetical protein